MSVVHSCKPYSQKVEEEQEFKVVLSYIVNLRLAWAL